MAAGRSEQRQFRIRVVIGYRRHHRHLVFNLLCVFFFYSGHAEPVPEPGNVHSDLLHSDNPKFGQPISNVTVPVGREAVIECVVEDLATFKVAWLRVDTQTILTIHSHVITKNHRIGVTHSDHRTWYLHIRDVRESDRGFYMCQINTDPMKSQVGFLQVVVPPDILDYPTSTDMVAREGSNVTLRCAANGSPKPNITWRREGGEPIPLGNNVEVPSVDGAMFNITKVNRLHMGAYLCIASNGVPPSVSKRIMLIVHFPPMIWIQNQLVGAYEGQQMTLECHSEAYPKSINYWTREKGDIIVQGAKYEPMLLNNAYKVHMKLTIKSVGPSDFGTYKCVSKNSLGDTDGSIKLYQIPYPSTQKPIITTVLSSSSQNPDKARDKKLRDRQKEATRPAPKSDIINEILNPGQEKQRDFHVRNKPTSDASNIGGGTSSGRSGRDDQLRKTTDNDYLPSSVSNVLPTRFATLFYLLVSILLLITTFTAGNQ